MAKTRSTSVSATMLSSVRRPDAMMRFKHATKIARFLTCSGKSAIPNAKALVGELLSMDSSHPGGEAPGSGEPSRLPRPSTMSSAPTATQITRPAVEMALPASPKRRSPKMPTTAQTVKYPSASAPALGRGRREPRNRMVRRSRGGAIEPPTANTRSSGRRSLMNVVSSGWYRRPGYHGFGVSLPRATSPLVPRGGLQMVRPTGTSRLTFLREGLAEFLLLLLWQVRGDDLEVVLLEFADHLIGSRGPAGEGKQRRGALRDLLSHLLDEVVVDADVSQCARHPAHAGADRSS